MKNKRLLAGPYLFWSVSFVVIPLLVIVYYAFTSDEGSFTFSNLAQITTPENLKALGMSILLSFLSTAICLILAYPLAMILSQKQVNQTSFIVLIFILPMWMNFLLRTYAWMTLLGITDLLQLFGLFGLGPFKMLNTSGAVVLGMVYNYLPYMILPLYTVMEKIDKSVIEAAHDLGCNNVKTMFKVVVPLSMPGIMSGITMVFVPAISTFIISRMLGGGSNLLIGDLIEMQFLGNSYNPNLGAAISLVLMVIILLIMTILNQFDDDEDKVLM